MIKTIVIAYTESRAKYAIRLLRPMDHLFFTIPLVVLGYSAGSKLEHAAPSLYLLTLLLTANILSISFAFAINEVEDAEDDKHDKNRKNPVARGHLTRNQALTISFFTAAISFTVFHHIGSRTMYMGLLMLMLSFLYSYKQVRLKSMPVADLISHGLMLSGLIFLSSFLAVSGNIRAVMPIFVGVTLVSIYGQFYNQVRDFVLDKKAKIKNTTGLLGMKYAKKAMYFSGILGISLIVLSFVNNLLPILPGFVSLLVIPLAITFKKFTSKRDLKVGIATSEMHSPALVIVNTYAVLFFLSLFI